MGTQFDKAHFYRKLAILALFSFAAFIPLICIQSAQLEKFQNSDYISCIYVGSKLFAQGRANEIYAPYNAVDFSNTPCNIAGHQFLPHLDPEHISLFNYCPLVAWLLAPLSYLPPAYSLIAWQAISLAALAVTTFLLVPGTWHSKATFLAGSLLFLPVAITLWIGQMDLVFGVLFYAIGYRLLTRGHPFLSGLAFSLACLKPQMVILPGFISLVLLLKREWRFLGGFATGIAGLAVANIAVGGVALMQQWFWGVRLAEKVFTDPTAGLAHYLIIGLAGVLLLSVFKQPVPWLKPVIYSIDLILGLFATYLCLRFSRHDPRPASYMGYTVILGLLAMPIMIPNYLYYDLSTLVIAAYIILDREFPTDLKPLLLKLMIVAAVGLDLYGLLFLIKATWASPVIPLVLLIGLFVRVAMIGLAKPGDSISTADA